MSTTVLEVMVAPEYHLRYYVDGGTKGRNPSPSGIYWSAGKERVSLKNGRMQPDGKFEVLCNRLFRNDFYTNNDAELAGLCWVFEHIRDNAGSAWLTATGSITVCSDSKFALNLVTGRQGSTIPRLAQWAVRARQLLAAAEDATEKCIALKWVPREENVKRLSH